LGISQLQRLDQFVSRRREIVANYNEAFESVEAIEIPQLRNPNDLDLTAWHLYTVQIEFESIGMTRTEFMNGLRTQGIGTQVLYIPVHLQPWYRRTYRYDHGKCPVAEDNYRKTISFPLYPSMAPEDVECVIKAVESLVPTTV
jgi:dTDP-4-amino-4,6-dideoxygalactose transaminase